MKKENGGVKGINWYAVNGFWLSFMMLVFLISCVGSDADTATAVDVQRDRSIEFEVWLPKGKKTSPLVLISHGTGGHYSDHRWLSSALVANGYAVAGLNHPGDTRKDQSPEGLLRVWDRPLDISFLLTHILDSPKWSQFIDSRFISVIGFSAGGHTAISLAGGVYDPQLMSEYCQSEKRGPDCDLAENVAVDFSGARRSYKDSRLSAVLALAPALGPGMSDKGLSGIGVPVRIIAAEDDELLIPDQHARHYARAIPHAELIMIPKGGHFVFLKCGLAGQIADYFIEQFDLCGREIDVDRDHVQLGLAKLAIEFLDEQLKFVE